MMGKISTLIIALCLAIAIGVGETNSPDLTQGLNEVATTSMTLIDKWERPRPPREHILDDEEKGNKRHLIPDPAPVKNQA